METKPSILIIDDEFEIGVFFRRLLQSKGYQVGVATTGDEAEALWENNSYQVAMIDLKLPDTDGLTLLKKIKEVQPDCEVIIMTGYATTRTAVKAIQLGAFDYIEKPFEDISEIEKMVEKVLDYKNLVNGKEHRPSWGGTADGVGLCYGNNEEMHRLLSIADRIAKKDINVLINGETGTGKEVLARFIHAASRRADQSFVAVNCGAMPENILESHLFGHEKGAFTGANNMHRGIFELANNGTLFLDEVGEASLTIQVKLLRVLETGEFYRVGGEKPIRTNVRIVAATNVDLEQAVQEKSFREDLFYRLDVVRLLLPPLRARAEDIPLLANFFLQRLETGEEVQISAEAMRWLKDYFWPGNLRELYNTISQAVALCDEKNILPEHLPRKIMQIEKSVMVKNEDNINAVTSIKNICEDYSQIEEMTSEELLDAYRVVNQLVGNIKVNLVQRGIMPETSLSLRDIEAQAIEEAITFHKGNITAASKALGVGRNTLYRKVKEYNIEHR
jgi:two-component system NtrC family response regulator